MPSKFIKTYNTNEMKTKNILICLLMTIGFSLINFIVAGQQTSGEYKISGTIADSTTLKPLGYITVSLKTDENTAIKAALTKMDGSFVFHSLQPLSYFITIISVGYRAKTISIDLTDSIDKSADLGTIYISTYINRLNEVLITANKPLIKQEIDRLTYDLQADPDSRGNSVLEMMRKVPFISLDAEENILLKGNSSYRILINGKPSSMVERNPKEILRSMPASTIQKIEVITNPPAKYDAEGLAGIINIIINKKLENGYNGSLNINEKFPAGGPGLGGSFTVKQDKLGVSGYGGASLYNVPQTIASANRNTFGTSFTNLIQNGTSRSNSKTGYLGTELSFEIDSLNLITGQFNINGSRSTGFDTQNSNLNGNEAVLQRYDLENNNERSGNGFDAALNYQLGFKANKNKLLTFSYRYYNFRNDLRSSLSVFNPLNYTEPNYLQDNHENSSEQTFQVDYVYPIKNLQVEAGLKGIFRDNKSDFQYLSVAENGQLEPDPGRINQFYNSQNIFGAYNSYQLELKNWGFKAGVRIEQTVIDADFISNESQIQQDYFTTIPSVAVNRKFKNLSSLNFGFSQRIKRPGINKLNPFVDRSNPNFESSGNPNLRPSLLNRMQLGYSVSKKATVNIGMDYSFIKNFYSQVSSFDPQTNITRSTFQNTGKARAISNYLNLNYPFSKKWNMSVNANVDYLWLGGTVNGSTVKNEGFVQSYSASTGYRFDTGWRLNANLNIIGRNIASLQGRSNSFVVSSFGVNKDLVKDKLSFSASASNPFTKYRNNQVETFGPNFIEIRDSQVYFRNYSLSLNYSFGQLKEAIKKNKRGIKNDDVSN